MGSGHSEIIYHKALEVELRLRQIAYSTKAPITMKYKNYIVGYGEPDLIVYYIIPTDNTVIPIIVELKATAYVPRASEKAQLLCYMRNLPSDYGI